MVCVHVFVGEGNKMKVVGVTMMMMMVRKQNQEFLPVAAWLNNLKWDDELSDDDNYAATCCLLKCIKRELTESNSWEACVNTGDQGFI